MGTMRNWAANQARKVYEALSGSAVGRAYVSDEDLSGFRPLSERVRGGMRRDLSPMSQAEMLRVAHYLYTSNPLAEFLINVPSALCMGSRLEYCVEINHEQLGITKEAADAIVDRAREFLDQWWNHPAHDFGGRALRYAKTQMLTGELLLIVTAVNPVTGLFQVDYVDADLVTGVEGLNRLSSVPGSVSIRGAGDGESKPYPVSGEGYFQGADSVFFFRMAGRLNSLRGFSYLLPVSDWIDSYDQSFFGQVDRFILGNTLVHDLRMEGGQEPDLKKLTDTFRSNASKPGGVFAHNEKVTHAVNTAQMVSGDDVEFQRQLRLHILGSKGIPEHWYGSGDNSNRSTSQSQNDIALKLMEALQDELAAPFRLILNVAWDQLAATQGFPARADGVSIYPKMPKISERDISQIGGVFSQTEAALDSAVSGERLSNATARKVTFALVEKITGAPVDEYAENMAIDTEAQAKAAKEKAQQVDAAQNAADKLAAAANVSESYNPSQPRDPQGTPTGGQWTSAEVAELSKMHGARVYTKDGEQAVEDAKAKVRAAANAEYASPRERADAIEAAMEHLSEVEHEADKQGRDAFIQKVLAKRTAATPQKAHTYTVNGQGFDSLSQATAHAKELGQSVHLTDGGRKVWSPATKPSSDKVARYKERKAAFDAMKNADHSAASAARRLGIE